MLYPKNVPMAERVLRVLIGLVLFGFEGIRIASGTPDSALTIVLVIGTATLTIITGFVGWCPACAMIGRKLKPKATR